MRGVILGAQGVGRDFSPNRPTRVCHRDRRADACRWRRPTGIGAGPVRGAVRRLPPARPADCRSRPRPTPIRSASFGGESAGRPVPATTAPVAAAAPPICVRTCDGRFFPLQRSASASPAELCKSFCPAAKTEVFHGSKIDHAVGPGGTRYCRSRQRLRLSRARRRQLHLQRQGRVRPGALERRRRSDAARRRHRRDQRRPGHLQRRQEHLEGRGVHADQSVGDRMGPQAGRDQGDAAAGAREGRRRSPRSPSPRAATRRRSVQLAR